MALVGECVEIKPSSFEEVVQQPIWVDAMLEEYEFIVQNNVWVWFQDWRTSQL